MRGRIAHSAKACRRTISACRVRSWSIAAGSRTSRAARTARRLRLPVRLPHRAARPSSHDVDVGIVIGATTEPAESIAFRVADVLTARSGVGRIDVTVLDDAPIRFLGRVLRSRVVLYSRDEPTRVEFESRIGRMADDVEVWAAPLDQDLLGAIADGRR